MPQVDLSLMELSPDGLPVLPIAKTRERKSKSSVAAQLAQRIAAAEFGAHEGDSPFTDEDLPSPDLLTPPPPRNVDLGKRELDAMGVKLMDALRTFRVEGDLVGRTTGPVVTQFEVAPAAGVKVRQIANLSNDLALAMRAQSIRIVAPIPGRGAVGVEVPNPTAEIVAFRELIESREFQGMRAALPVALGKDLEGRPVIADLAKMPHLLIAGATGSGKSVCINTLITSLVYRHTPETLRFLMIDPKMVELSVYNVLPHLRHKVVTDNRDAAAVLKWAVLEMQDRYELLAANGARNIQDFNRKVQEGVKLKNAKRNDVAFENLEYMGGIVPYIVLIIDELADLMMTVQGEIETPLAMLAQKARDRNPPDSGDAASERERDYRIDQGEFSEPHRIPRGVAGRQPHDPRRHRRRVAPRQRRHAVHPAGEVRAGATAGRLHLERGHRAVDGLVRAAPRAAEGRVRGAGPHRRRDAERAGHHRVDS